MGSLFPLKFNRDDPIVSCEKLFCNVLFSQTFETVKVDLNPEFVININLFSFSLFDLSLLAITVILPFLNNRVKKKFRIFGRK